VKKLKASPEDLVKGSVGNPKVPKKDQQILRSGENFIEDDEPVEPRWKLKYLYDGGCTVCLSLVKMLQSRRGASEIFFEDIASPEYSAVRNKGITYEDAMATIHVLKPDGQVLLGMEALRALYSQVGLGWVFRLAQLPLLNKAAEIIYSLISKNRMALGSGMDAVMAVGRISMERSGTGTCEADGECRAKDEEPKPQAEGEKKDERGDGDEEDGSRKPVEPILGSWIDHEHVLGIYTYGKGEGLRAAPIDVESGKFLVPGHSIRLKSHDFETLITAIDELISKFQWKGAIGLGLPGLLSRRDKVANEWLPESLRGSINMSTRRSKWEFEHELKTACNHDVVVMGGSEANGFGEMAYGSGKDLQGLVLMVTVGRGIGAALFDNGLLVKNISGILADILWTWDLTSWDHAQLPSEDEMDDESKWDAWGERVRTYLLKLEEFCQPDYIIMGGSATSRDNYERLLPRLGEVKTPIIHGALGQLAGVKGAAAGAANQLILRDDLAALRAAIGRKQAVSPSAMSEDDIKEAFALFDKEGTGDLDPDQVADAMQRLGVQMTKHEIREMIFDMDMDNSGTVSFDEFRSFWKSLVRSNPVTVMHTLAEYNNLLDEESTSGRLIVLEVGFTYCKPCRAFEGSYHSFAKRFKDARFVRINGNENQEMVTLGRDILKVRSSPSFFLFRNKEVVYRFSGAKKDKFEDAILSHLQPGEAGYVEGYHPVHVESSAQQAVAQ